MKSKCNLLFVLFMLVSFATYAGNVEKTKEFHQTWDVNNVKNLKVINKYGDIKINDNGGNEVTIDVVATVETSTEKKADDLLDQIDVNFSKNSDTVIAETVIDNTLTGKKEFSIDYTINIPSDKNLDIDNKFGNVVINELNAKGKFNVEYGSLTAHKLNGAGPDDINIDLSYSKGSIETLSDATLEIKYTTYNITEAGNIQVDSKYSIISVDRSKGINTNSKYDTYNIGNTGSVTADAKYSHIQVDELQKSLKVDSEYGSLKVSKVDPDFESINVENSYGAVNLGISDESSYNVNASCSYCNIDYDQNSFKGNRMSENNSKKIDGTIGNGTPTGKVVVTSKYGGIKLR